MMYFSIALINPKDGSFTLDTMTSLVKNTMKSILPIEFIDYSTFKKHTESKPTPLYIMEKKNIDRMEEVMDIKMMKDVYKSTGIKLGSYCASIDQAVDPRFMILDVHLVNIENVGKRFLVRLAHSKILPVSTYLIMNKFAATMPANQFIIDVFVVAPEKNCDIESYAHWENGRLQEHGVTRVNSGIIGKYTKTKMISINDILGTMDNNIDVLMAQYDLAEYEDMLAAYKSSKDFMEKAKLTESREYRETIGQVKDTERRVADCRQAVTKEPNVVSSYIRIYNPRELEKYQIREVNFTDQVQRDFWGNLGSGDQNAKKE